MSCPIETELPLALVSKEDHFAVQTTVSVGGSSASEPVVLAGAVLRSERFAVRAVSRTSDLHARANIVPPSRVWVRVAGTTPRKMVFDACLRRLRRGAHRSECTSGSLRALETRFALRKLMFAARRRARLVWLGSVFICWRGCQTRVELARCRATWFEEAFAVFLLDQHGKAIRGWPKVDWATELQRVSEVAQAAADRGELRLVYQSAQTLRRRRSKTLRSVAFPDGSAATNLRSLGARLPRGASRDHDGDVEPEGCGLTRVAAVEEGAEWAPLRENIAEGILSVGLNRGVGCDMVPVELLKCSPPSSARILEPLFAKTSAQTLLPHAWMGLFGGHGPKDQRLSGEKESWPSQPHGKSFFKAQRKRLSPVLEEAALPTQMTEQVGRQPEASRMRLVC